MRRSFTRALALGLTVAGCNTILDNRPGTLREETPADVGPMGPTSAEGGSPSVVPTTPRPPNAQTGRCPSGHHLCDELCVATSDPLHGCGDPSCKPCATSHGTPTCQGSTCAMATCDRGYADCNEKPSDGCETDLSRAATCGSCTGTCTAASPVCAPSVASSFECSTGCTAVAPLLCGNECVSPLTSVNHCGGCNLPCPAIEQATTSCNAGRCNFACKTGHHACGATCAQDTDARACGPMCVVCPDAPNATGICQANACALTCAADHADCNNNPADGCEASTLTDVAHCGGCGKVCRGTCTNGVCTPGDAGAPVVP